MYYTLVYLSISQWSLITQEHNDAYTRDMNISKYIRYSKNLECSSSWKLLSANGE